MKARWLARRERAWTPGKAAALYLALGLAWVWLGDRWLFQVVHDAQALERAQGWKGGAYVALTAVLAAWLVWRLGRAERLRRASEEQLSTLVQHASAGIARVALDGRVLWANARLLDMLGIDERALGAVDFGAVAPPREPVWVARQMGRLLVGEIDHFVGERQCVPADGREPLPTLCTTTTVPESEGSAAHLVCVLQDLSEVVRARSELERSQARLQLALEGSASGVWDWDLQAQRLSCSPGIERMLGYTGDCLERDLRLSECMVLADRRRLLAAARRAIKNGQPLVETFSVRCFDGQLRWFEARGQRYAAAHGGPERFTGLLTDLSGAYHAEERQRLAAAVVDNAAQGVVVTDALGNIRSANAAAQRILGYGEAELLGQNPRIFQSGRHDRPFYQALWDQLLRTGQWQGELWNKRKNGEIFPEQAAISAVRDAGGSTTHFICMFTDQSQQKASEQRIEYLAGHDALTGLANRETFAQKLEAVRQQALHNGEQFAVLQLNLDRFKEVNDSYGYTVGDAVLRHIANQVQRALRPGDVIGRLAGDELAVVARQLRHGDGAAAVARHLIEAAASPWRSPEGVDVVVGASVGICMFPQHVDSSEALLQGAHAAVYGAKALGRGAWCFYEEGMTQAARERLAVEAGLRRALARGELRLHFQPQCDVASGRIVGAEALLRWQDPQHGLVPPGRFIPVAESSGLIAPIGRWVLQEACQQAQRWRVAGLGAMTMAVNVSPRQFALSDLVDEVGQALAQSGFAATSLELEITESALAERPERALALLNRLGDLGLRLAVDDFGTGYSSLAHIKRFPIDVLKIDQSFIREIPQSGDDMAISSAIIAMGHSMGLAVLAEGVQTQAQLDFLRERGCDRFQGFLRSRPVPPDAFEALLREQARG
ncbi:MAG: EAL domain-containing protein [Burkholderiaceae bacterium]|nr:EAL domain-containing protein [Burkholderiaceae bacterium]MCO5104151.1 EAL domain-containing protein [Burkholderiaceae bacterium]